MKKISLIALSAIIAASMLTACGSKTPAVEPVVENFAVDYRVEGTTSAGLPKDDSYIFEGVTTDGIITELTFDVIRNKGLEGEYSKTDIMGYLMNISDAKVVATEDGFALETLTSNGYDLAYGEGRDAQFMVTATIDALTDETTFKDLTFTSMGKEVELEKAIVAFAQLAKENGVEELTEDTLVKDLLAARELYVDGAFVEGENRVSFAGFNGGRSYGEQIEAIRVHILDNKMTLENVYEMFTTANQADSDILDRDLVAGATITFIPSFAEMVKLAMNNDEVVGDELPESELTHTVEGDNTVVHTTVDGYAGAMEVNVVFDAENKLADVIVVSSKETDGIGLPLTVEGSDFIVSLIENNGEINAVAGENLTSNDLIKAVDMAKTYIGNM